MILLGVLLLIMGPFLMGIVVNEIGRKKETNQIETYLSGFFFLFLMQGGIFFVGIYGNLTFSMTSKILLIAILAIVCVGLLIGVIKRKKYFAINVSKVKLENKKDKLLYLSLFIIVAIQIYTMFAFMPAVRDDIMLETMITTLSTDTMYQYHPLTGSLMSLGMIGSKKLITLSMWYSFLSKYMMISPAVALYVVGSACTLILSYFAYGCVFYTLFLGDLKKTIIGLNFLGLLYLAGDYYTMTIGYQQLYYGYAGEVICVSVMIPYLMYIIYCRKESWILTSLKVLMCLAVAVLIAPMGTGVMNVLIAIGIMILLDLTIFIRRKKCKQS
ncbi:MAG: DUF6077 domain-containing protein [Eubacteriales bacterium]